jgi:hypothetical protein
VDDNDVFFASQQPNLVGSSAAMLLIQRSPTSCNCIISKNDNEKDDDPRSSSLSLLDNDDLASVVTTTTTTTPTTPFSPETPSPIISTLPLCGVAGCWSVPEEGAAAPGNSTTRAAACMEDGLQDYLYEFLSNPSSAGGIGASKSFPWQAMLTSMADDSDDDNDDEDDDDSEEREIKKHRMKILRNRAIHLQARKERLDTLRRDLHPFSGPATPPPPGCATGSSLAMIGKSTHVLLFAFSHVLLALTLYWLLLGVYVQVTATSCSPAVTHSPSQLQPSLDEDLYKTALFIIFQSKLGRRGVVTIFHSHRTRSFGKRITRAMASRMDTVAMTVTRKTRCDHATTTHHHHPHHQRQQPLHPSRTSESLLLIALKAIATIVPCCWMICMRETTFTTLFTGPLMNAGPLFFIHKVVSNNSNNNNMVIRVRCRLGWNAVNDSAPLLFHPSWSISLLANKQHRIHHRQHYTRGSSNNNGHDSWGQHHRHYIRLISLRFSAFWRRIESTASYIPLPRLKARLRLRRCTKRFAWKQAPSRNEIDLSVY